MCYVEGNVDTEYVNRSLGYFGMKDYLNPGTMVVQKGFI